MTIFGCKAFSTTQVVMWKVQRHSNTSYYWKTHTNRLAYTHLMFPLLFPLQPRRKANLMDKGVYMNSSWCVNIGSWLLTIIIGYRGGNRHISRCLSISHELFLRHWLCICNISLYSHISRQDRLIFIMTFSKCNGNEINIVWKTLSLIF